MSYFKEAFDIVCEDNKEPEQWFVCLIDYQRCYGGPEEGGWWYSVRTLEAYKEYPTKELADQAAERVRELANELSKQARMSHGDFCLRQLEWLDARGLDADWLPENDGPSEYEVCVCEEIPVFNNRRPEWC